MAELEEYTRLVTKEPNNALGYIARGNIYKSSGYIGQSIADYNKAIDLESDNQYYYVLRGLAYFTGKRLDKAKADFIAAIKLNAKTAIAKLAKAKIALMENDYDSVDLELDATLNLIIKEQCVCSATKKNP